MIIFDESLVLAVFITVAPSGLYCISRRFITNYLLHLVGGKGCTVYDVVVNPSFFETMHSREILMGFFLTVVLEGLEAKYNISLDRGSL